MRRRAGRSKRAVLAVALTALACCLAVHGHSAAQAQTEPSGWLDATAFAAGADGSIAPLAGVQLVLLTPIGAEADLAETDDAGNARLVDRPGVYALVASHDGYVAAGSLACGDSSWNTDVVAADGSLSEPALTFKLGTRLCQQYLFTEAPPPANPIYLTFDDGYLNLCATVALVHDLGIHATFFRTGQAILTYPDCVRQLVADGDTLGNHTYAHEDLTLLSQAGIT
ncbi:MAG: polysaccharide deacetylase family protein, partial [Dehalococcoidia bacterium]